MKKFNKLLLVILAGVSFIFFLVYKYRYDRLYNVMQVLEVFGSPSDQSCLCGESGSNTTFLPVVTPTWQEVDRELLHVYGAYCTSLPGDERACGMVSAQGLAFSDLKTYTCKLWYDGSVGPLAGTFKAHSSESQIVSELHCESKFPDKVPYGVSFQKDADVIGPVVPVLAAASYSRPPALQICLLPPSLTGEDHTPQLQESVLYHSLLGVRHFILYSPVVSLSMQKVISKLAQDANVQFRHHPWNPPRNLDSLSARALITSDCYHQSAGFQNYAVLEHNQLLVPARAENLTRYLTEVSLPVGPVSLPLRRFCSEYPNDKKSASLPRSVVLFESTYYNKKLSLVEQTEIYHKSGGQSSPSTENDLKVHQYGPCDLFSMASEDKVSIYDQTAGKFGKSMLSMLNRYAS